MKIVPVILCGGAGTRLWPLSREHYPKPLLTLANHRSLLQNTVLRVRNYRDVLSPILVCNEEHRFLVAEQLRETGTEPAAIILEPEGRNTAPAVALGAHQILRNEPDAIIVILHSDHVIVDNKAFLAALDRAVSLAEQGYLVTFGVTPTHAETGYGYIRVPADNSGDGVNEVEAFVEKPDTQTATEYLASGNYYWNSGMFVCKARTYLSELAEHRPDIANAIAQTFNSVVDDGVFTRVDKDTFLNCPAESIDYAVMEKTERAVMVPLVAGWGDIGSWDALWEMSEKDADQNVLVGDAITQDVKNSYIRAEHRLVSVVGVDDLIVVETADAVLVSNRGKSQHVRKIVHRLRSSERREPMTHRKVYRPWGYYESVDEGERHQVKHIHVNPGSSLSLQKHLHRAEHWVVVTGVARVTKGEEVFQLEENESTYIPSGTVHRLANPGASPLEIVEIQSGSYLGEDDIIRLEDNYGRK